MRFYLGTHLPRWLEREGPPLFVSATRLRRQRRVPRAVVDWCLDSGGFTQLSQHGRWTVHPLVYALEVRDWQERVGRLVWAAPQDWMCEPAVLRRTGRDVAYHQAATIASYQELRTLAPGVPWVPVLQGWTAADYLRHLEDYARTGLDLRTVPTVAVGTLCRRQATTEAADILTQLHTEGLALHAFGFKRQGLRLCAPILQSADSLAWSIAGRYGTCTHGSNGANCRACALAWYAQVEADFTPG